MESAQRVRCNHCMSEFDEEHIQVPSSNFDVEICPVCRKSGALMDVEKTIATESSAKLAEYLSGTAWTARYLEEKLEAHDAAIRAEAMQLPRVMLDEIRKNVYQAITLNGVDFETDEILARYGYTVKEDA